jgi:prephenate dehydrogenase
MADIILFCIPVNEIIKIINHNNAIFKSGSLIIEISSVKSAIHKTLSAISLNLNVVTLCIHPMFGPGASVFSNNKVIFIPVNSNNRKTEEDLLNKVFPSFDKILIENPNKHDLAISVIISLIYFINIVFSKFLVDLSNTKEFKFEDDLIQFFNKISGSTFKIQSLLSESILTDDVSLFLTLFVDNDKSAITINKYRQLFEDLLAKIETKDQDFIRKYIITTKNSIEKDVDINKSYELLYKFLNS